MSSRRSRHYVWTPSNLPRGVSFSTARLLPYLITRATFRPAIMKNVVVIIACCLLMTSSLLMLAIQPPVGDFATHRMMMGVNEQLIVDELRRSSKPSGLLRVSDHKGSATKSKRKTEWSNRYNLVHIITSRFMQHQASLTHLARARLELLKAITLPSLQHQTNKDFLWILRVDPHLDADILAQLLDATKTMENLVIHKTNANPEGFRSLSKEAYKTLANPKSRPLLESYIQAAQTRTVLETRLDADDALMVNFVEQIQHDAYKQFQQVPDKWMVWCIENHLEWQQNSPWQENASAIVGWKLPHCVTPGLTWGYPAGVTRDDSVTAHHHKIHKLIPHCQDTKSKKLGNCLHRLDAVWPMALRARTITSAGMANLVLDHEKDPLAASLRDSQWKDLQPSLWSHLEDLFSVKPSELAHVRRELVEHMHDIATDALKGQCTAGHSCKQRSKDALKQLVKVSAKSL